MKSKVDSCLLIFGGFLLHFIGLGLAQSFGSIYSQLLNFFQSSKSETTWIASINSFLFLSCGSIGGILVKRYGYRRVAVFGSTLAAIGTSTSMFVPSLYYLYLTYGLIAGIGSGLFNVAAGVSLTVGFDKRRSLAMAVGSSGGGIGTFVLPLLTTFCLEEYGWRGTFLILSGIILQGVLAGLLLQSSTKRGKEHPNPGETNLEVKSGGNKKAENSRNLKVIYKAILSNGCFILFTLSGIFTVLAYFVPYIMIPDFVKDKGFTNEEAAFVITISGISGIIGRVAVGFIADIKCVDRFVLNGLALILGGVCTFLLVLADQIYAWFIAYGIILGIFTGVFAFLQPVLVSDILGTEDLDIAFGVLLLVQGICALIGPPVAGLISDKYGRYEEAFMYAGSLFFIGGVISVVLPIKQRHGMSKKYNIDSG